MRLEISIQPAVGQDDLPSEEDCKRWLNDAVQIIDATPSTHPSQLTLRFVDETEGQALNQQFRNKNYATNVLAFPSVFPEELPPELVAELGDFHYLGDLVICPNIVRQEAREQGKSISAHYAHLLIHGLLHLYGFDHETESDATHMETLEIQILGQLGYANPYADEATYEG